MTDLATLVLAVDSSAVKTGTAALDGLSAAGARAEAATLGLGRGTKSAGAEAAALAAAAQASARAAVGQAAGFSAVTNAVHGNTIAMRESLVVGRELLSGNLTRLPGSLSILAQQFAISGKGASGFASQLLQSFGIIKTAMDADLASEAAAARTSAAAVEAAAARAQANVLAADTEVALAEAAIKAAATSEALTAAQAELAGAHAAVAAAAEGATIAEIALANAQARAAAAGDAAAKTSVTRLTGFGVGLVSVAAAAALAEGAFKAFQAEVSDSGVLDRYANSLGLTAKQIKNLKDVTITWKDVALGFWDSIADYTGARAGLEGFKQFFIGTFEDLLKTGIDTYAEIYGAAAGAYRAIIVIWQNFPAALGDIFIQGVNAAIGAINKLLQASVDGVNSFISGVNAKFGTSLGEIAAPQLDRLTNSYAGAAKKVGGAFKAEIDKATAEGRKQAQGFISDLEKNIIGEAEKRIKAQEDASAKKPKKANDHGLADALAQLDAQIEGQNRLAAAYQVSDAAAIKAEALQKAEEQAIRHKGEIGIFYEKELALAIATRSAEGAKVIADLRFEADSRAAVNSQIAAGIIPANQASQALELEAKLRPLTAAASIAEGDAKARLIDIIRNLTNAYENNNAEIARTAALQQIANNNDSTAKLEKQIELVGKSNRVQAVALAILEAQQKIKNENTPADQQQALIDSYVAQANAAVSLTEKQNNYNASLTATADMLQLIEANAQSLSTILSDAFGNVGDQIGKALTALTTYQAQQQSIADWAREEKKKAGTDATQLANIEARAQQKSANAQLDAIGGVIDATKNLFDKHSAAYKAMDAVEKAFAIAQLARTIISIAPKVAAGAATMFSQLGVFAFPAVAAMIALMASLGFGGGGGSVKAPTSPEDLQKAAGTGTVLGDASAKSNSIAQSLELMSKNSTKGLDYSSAMVASLRKIESGIGNLTAAIAKELQVGGALDTSTLGLGTKTTQGFSFLGAALGGLLGGILGGKKTVTTSVFDQGIQFNPTSLANAITNGISGSLYTIIETVTKKSGALFGLIGGGTKTSYSTTTSPIDQDLQRQTGLILASLRDSVVSAAKVLGLDVSAALDAFQVEIGKISFKDLTGQQITDQLNAVFSKIGDQMAGFAVSGLEQFQKAGEGLYETLMRLAKDYLTIDAALKSIGMTFGSVGTASVAARESLIDLAGGLDAFVSQVNFFYDHFLTDAQKVAFEQQQVTAAFQAMGIAAPTTIAGFTQLVQGLDLSTTAGQAMFEQLMQIAPAFYDVASAADQLAQKQQALQVQLLQAQGNTAAATALQRQITLAATDPSLVALQKAVWAAQDAAAAAAAATDLANKKTQIQIQLLQAQGKATEALALQRKAELATLDPALRALQQQLYHAQDIATAKDNLTEAYKRESQALQDTADKFRKFATDLKAFRDSLFTGSSGPQSYNAALVQLMKQAGLATAGNEDALGGGLQDSASKFLDIATQNASSLQDVERARALVARYLDQAIGSANGQASVAEQQLAQMKTQVGALVDINDSVLTVAQAIKQLNALLAPTSTTTAATTPRTGTRTPTGTTAQTEKMQDTLDRIHKAVEVGAVASRQTHRILNRVTRGGESLTVSTDADTPIASALVLE